MKEGMQHSPFQLVFDKEALLPLEVEIPALQMLMKLAEKSNVAYENRLLDMQEAQLDRLKAVEHNSREESMKSKSKVQRQENQRRRFSSTV